MRKNKEPQLPPKHVHGDLNAVVGELRAAIKPLRHSAPLKWLVVVEIYCAFPGFYNRFGWLSWRDWALASEETKGWYKGDLPVSSDTLDTPSEAEARGCEMVRQVREYNGTVVNTYYIKEGDCVE